MRLVIGNKNYSSWSMRPWILLKHFGIEFEEIRIPLFVEGFQQELQKYSPNLKVPVLLEGTHSIWDSLAIVEYINEKYLTGRGLPAELQARARCRSYCSEMHSGFMAIRNEMPMNCRQQRQIVVSELARQDVLRIDEMWTEAREQSSSKGDYLFGDFSLADCMFAPVVMRFNTYPVELSASAQSYLDTLLANPAVDQWCEEAKREAETIPDYEIGTHLSP